ncbi:MAG: Fic family protein [Flavobacteriales bacterium]
MDGSYTYYTFQGRMLNLLASIYHRLGEVQARHLQRPAQELEKAYQVSAVHATLAIEGNVLDLLPMADLVAHRTPASGAPEALEVVNTHHALELLPDLEPSMASDLRQAHGVLMHGLSLEAGHFRTGPMEVMYGDPPPLRTAPAENLPVHVEELLHFIENDDAPPIITSCLLHFGLIYLRPFSAGNGRIARLWQRRVLMRHWPVFAFLPVEAFILRTQAAYIASLEYADRQGDCGSFIVYLMERMDEALAELLAQPNPVLTGADRIALFLKQAPDRAFRRKDYLNLFPELSTATASRDLAEAVERSVLALHGTKRQAHYKRIN